MASWLVRSPPALVVRVEPCAGTLFCVLGRGTSLRLTVPLLTQVYNWISVNLILGVTLQWISIPSRGE